MTPATRGNLRALAIVPAAGAARRMGRPKLLLPFAGTTLLGAVVAALKGGGVERLALVVAPGDHELRRFAQELGLCVAVNRRPKDGMLSSILAGLEALGGAELLASAGAPLLITPGDLPLLRPDTVRQVLAAVAAGAPLALPVHRGRRGHPLGLAAAEIPRIPSLDAQIGLRQLLSQGGLEPRRIEVDDPGILLDVDTPEEYAHLLRSVRAPAGSGREPV